MSTEAVEGNSNEKPIVHQRKRDGKEMTRLQEHITRSNREGLILQKC